MRQTVIDAYLGIMKHSAIHGDSNYLHEAVYAVVKEMTMEELAFASTQFLIFINQRNKFGKD